MAEACHPHGTVVLAGLGHCGGQGSSAYSQSVMWAPSRVADVISREMPVAMEEADIDGLVAGFAAAARRAVASGLDGVEVDAGYCSLLRQFHSGLTNQRADRYGDDRLLLTTRGADSGSGGPGPGSGALAPLVLRRTGAVGRSDPRAAAAAMIVELAAPVDLVVVVRGGPFSASAYRPDDHTPAGFNLELCRQMRQAVEGRAAVVLQGSVVDPARPKRRWTTGVADLVEMTRAQIAEPRLVGLVRGGQARRARPCILCNQACHVRDARNPLVSCVGEPRSGHETVEPPVEGRDPVPLRALVVGAGVAGLECARVLSARGHQVRVVERSDRTGGTSQAAAMGPGRGRLALLAQWLADECRAQGVTVETGVEVWPDDLDAARADGTEVVLATGSRPAPWSVPGDDGCPVLDPLVLLSGGTELLGRLPEGPVVVHDPVGGPIGVGVAEWLAGDGRPVALVTPDQIAGTLLSLTGDLADSNTRLQQAGVRRELRALLRRVEGRAGPPGRCVDRPGSAPSTAPWWSTAVTAYPRRACTWPDREPAAAGDCVRPAACSKPCWRVGGWPWTSPGRSAEPRCSRGGGGPVSAADADAADAPAGWPEGGPDHRGRPGSGPEPRGAAGPPGSRHHRRRPVRDLDVHPLPPGPPVGPGRDRPAGARPPGPGWWRPSVDVRDASALTEAVEPAWTGSDGWTSPWPTPGCAPSNAGTR